MRSETCLFYREPLIRNPLTCQSVGSDGLDSPDAKNAFRTMRCSAELVSHFQGLTADQAFFGTRFLKLFVLCWKKIFNCCEGREEGLLAIGSTVVRQAGPERRLAAMRAVRRSQPACALGGAILHVCSDLRGKAPVTRRSRRYHVVVHADGRDLHPENETRRIGDGGSKEEPPHSTRTKVPPLWPSLQGASDEADARGRVAVGAGSGAGNPAQAAL